MRPIDGDVLEEAFEQLADKLRHDGRKTDAQLLEALAAIVKFCPTLDVEPIRRGRWIHHEDELLGADEECSVCHIHTLGVFPRCPVCGAYMGVAVLDEAPAVDNPAVDSPADSRPAVDSPAVDKGADADET